MSCCQYASYAFDVQYVCTRCVLRSRAVASAMQRIRMDETLHHKRMPPVTLNGLLRAYVKPSLDMLAKLRNVESGLVKTVAPLKTKGTYILKKAVVLNAGFAPVQDWRKA